MKLLGLFSPPPIKRVSLTRDLIKKSMETSVRVGPLAPLCNRFRNLLKKISKGTEGNNRSRKDRVDSFLRVISVSLLFPYTTG